MYNISKRRKTETTEKSENDKHKNADRLLFSNSTGGTTSKTKKTNEFQKVRNDEYDNADRFCCEMRPGVQNQQKKNNSKNTNNANYKSENAGRLFRENRIRVLCVRPILVKQTEPDNCQRNQKI